MRRGPLAIVAAMILLSSSGGSQGPTLPGAKPPQGHESTHTISQVPDAPSEYLLYVPASYVGNATNPTALVLVLHGNPSSSAFARDVTEFNQFADREGWLVLYPQAFETVNGMGGSWPFTNTSEYVRGSITAKALQEMVNDTRDRHHDGAYVDMSKIFITGLSGGGHMTTLLAALYPEYFRAAAPALAFEYEEEELHGAPPNYTSYLAASELNAAHLLLPPMRLPIITFHGGNDPIIPVFHSKIIARQFTNLNDFLDGGLACLPPSPLPFRDSDYRCDDSVDSELDACERVEDNANHTDLYNRFWYTDEQGKTVVERWVVNNMGHAWSGSHDGQPNHQPFVYADGPGQSENITRFFRDVLAGAFPTLPMGPYHCDAL